MGRRKRLSGRQKRIAQCVVPEKNTFKPPKSFVLILVLIVLLTMGLALAGMPLATSIQLVAAVLATIGVVWQLTGSPVTFPGRGTAR